LENRTRQGIAIRVNHARVNIEPNAATDREVMDFELDFGSMGPRRVVARTREDG